MTLRLRPVLGATVILILGSAVPCVVPSGVAAAQTLTISVTPASRYTFAPLPLPDDGCDGVDPWAFSPSLTYTVLQCEHHDARPAETLLVHPDGRRVVVQRPAVAHPTISYLSSVTDDGWAAGVVMEAPPVPTGPTLVPALWSPAGELFLGTDVVAGQRVAVINAVAVPGGGVLASVESQPSRDVATWWWAPGQRPTRLTPPEGFTGVRILDRGTVARNGEATLSLTGAPGVHAVGRWSRSQGLRVQPLPAGYAAFEPYAVSESGRFVLGRGDADHASHTLVSGRGVTRVVPGLDAANAWVDDYGDAYGRSLRGAGGTRGRVVKVTATATLDLTLAASVPPSLAATGEIVALTGAGDAVVRYQVQGDDRYGVLRDVERRTSTSREAAQGARELIPRRAESGSPSPE